MRTAKLNLWTRILFNFLTVLGLLFSSACITVRLGKDADGKHAEGVHYVEPASPFQKDPRDEVDAAWKNPKNGNVISFLSDCSDKSDPPLDQVVQGTLSGLNNLHMDSQESPTVQGRAARRALASGTVDGVPSMIDLLVFKRNMCIYILSYVGVKKSFPENRAQFEQFLSGFVAP